MTRSGFAAPALTPSDDGSDRAREIEARSIPIEDVKYDIVTIGDYAERPLQLPIGLFIDGEDEGEPKQRITEFTIRPNIHLGDFDEFLANLDPKQGDNPKRTVDTICAFLGGGKTKDGYHLGAIESLGGYDFREFVSQKTKYTSGAQLISNMFLGDVATIMFAARLQIGEYQGIDEETGEQIDKNRIAVERECPAPDCRERCRSFQTLKDIKIKSIPGLTDKPLFKFTLQHEINDGKSVIKHFYVEPLKLYQLGLFITGNKVPDIEMITAMVSEIPESEMYGRKAGSPLCSDLYKRMSTRDISALRNAAGRLNPGPVTIIDGIACACGQETFPYQINWARLPRQFLYQSFDLTTDDDL